jgi:ribosomal protein L32
MHGKKTKKKQKTQLTQHRLIGSHLNVKLEGGCCCYAGRACVDCSFGPFATQ